MRAGGRPGAQQALSGASLTEEPLLRFEGLFPGTAQVPVPREESGGWGGLALQSPGCPRSLLSVRVQTSLEHVGLGSCEDSTPQGTSASEHR